MSSQVRIGISGWRYVPWRGVFYPAGLRQRDELAYAASRFSTIEINGSFYSLQRPEFYQRWHDETPPGFIFSVKGPRYVTHMLRLRDVGPALANFFASGVANLRDKLGPFLWQLPPTLAYDPTRLDAFFALLPRDSDQASRLARRHNENVRGRARLAFGDNRRLRHALEIRHQSFVDPAFVAQLRRRDVALVVADTAGRWPLLEDATSDFVYVRLHGASELYASGYGVASIDRWAKRIEHWRKGIDHDDARLAAPSDPREAHRPRRFRLLRQRRQGQGAARCAATGSSPRRRVERARSNACN